MKKVKFKKISIQNFLSSGNEPIEIDFSNGFNLITGINKDEGEIHNAVGKTLIIDALYFAIFGNTLRELSNKSFIVNRQNGRNCKVRLEFEQLSTRHDKEEFVIERSLQPNKLSILKNGVDKTKSTIPETNKYIKEVLSAEEEVFQNCIMLRANSTVPFMLKRKTDKKNFIESIFNLSIFSDMLKDVREDLKQVKHDYDISNTELDSIKNNKVKYESEIKRLKQEAESRLKQAQNVIDGIKGEIEKYKKDIISLEEKRQLMSDSKSKLDKVTEAKQQADKYLHKLLQDKYRIDAQITSCKKQLIKIQQHGTICPTCKREYDEAHKSNIESAKVKLEQDIDTSNAELIKIQKSESELSEVVSKITKQIQALSNEVNEFNYLHKQINNIYELIKSKEQQIHIITTQSDDNAITSFVELLDKTIIELDTKKDEVKKKEQEITKLNICEHILGEYGIRAYIINKLLELLNNRISFYLESFKSTFNFRFNELFEDEIKDSNGTICSYGNCSGAEMKKIDLAISFAFIDILKYHKQLEYNIMFMDEILDSSLDTKSLEYVIQFISEYTMQNEKALYLITHKSDVNLENINETIMLEKEDGFTRLVS